VDMATLKAEYLYQTYREKGTPWRARMIANLSRLNRIAMYFPALSNAVLRGPVSGGAIKRLLGVAPQRSLPALHSFSLRRWWRRWGSKLTPRPPVKGKVWFFCDEFTNYNDTPVGIKAIELLLGLGYEVGMAEHPESGRAAISKGLLDLARAYAEEQVRIWSDKVSHDIPLVGVEPSAILSFRDEYPRLAPQAIRDRARALGAHALMIEEFLWREAEAGKLDTSRFHRARRRFLLHGHCHQKALSRVDYSALALSLPENYSVEIVPSGCCGMAGAFGYEKAHYEVSMKIAELTLLPAVRAADPETLIIAPGTSCRHQISDGTGRQALHPVEALWAAIEKVEQAGA
jgi:Fe-S oxidoreductase